jgi:hypothetical protein
MISPILITGCARSGTSMTAGIIDICGGYGGRLPPAGNPNNKKGFFENREVTETLVKPYLVLCGADPMGQKPLPDPRQLIPLGGLAGKVEQIYKYQGYKDGPWYFKGAKLCLIWPVWNAAFPDAKWVIVRRKDEDIVYSCMRTSFMRAHKSPAGWQTWVDHHKARFEEMRATLFINTVEVWPSKFIEGDFSEIRGVVEGLGLEWNDEAVKDFVSPELWRSKDGQ